MPSVAGLQYTYLFTGVDPVVAEAEKTAEGGQFLLEAGKYTVKVAAYTDTEKTLQAAEGVSGEFTVTAGAVTPVDVAMKAVVSEGVGTFLFTVSYPDTLTVTPEISLVRIAGDAVSLGWHSETGEGVNTYSGSKSNVPAGYYVFMALLKNSDGTIAGRSEAVHIYQNMTSEAAFAFTTEDFTGYLVTSATDTDSYPGTLRWALYNATDGASITIALPPGSVIELKGTLYISKSVTIEGNGVTLTRSPSWTTSDSSSQLCIIGSFAQVTIRRVHFKDGRATYYGAGIDNDGELILESCVFSGNQSSSGGAIYSTNTLTLRGCTFYGNTSASYDGAVYFWASGKTLTMTGNLFYGNTATSGFSTVYVSGTVVASYNAVDKAFGTDSAQSGWAQGTGDTDISADGWPVSGKSFRLLSGSAAAGVLTTLPEGYPTRDFYGNTISAGAAAGAVQSSVSGSGYYLETGVNSSDRGTMSASPTPNADGIVPAGSVVLTATANAGYGFGYWLVNGVNVGGTNPLTHTLAAHSKVIAVFSQLVTSLADSGEGTLRAALTGLQDEDMITITVGTPGTDAIALESALPQITTKSVTIEGNGVTLTRAASWTATSGTSQLLYINSSTAQVTIRRVHFKDGRATDYGAGIRNAGALTLESCVFSGNQTSATSAYGGAIYSSNKLTLRGCTFYGNTAGYVGAVYFSAFGKTLTMTGNLFYGNTASYYYTVYRGSGTVAASYNAVDKAFGTGSTQSGWTAGTGDKNISAGGSTVVSPTTFRPYTGSAAAGVVTILPEGYPTRDFYGDTISAGAYAGAVQGSAGDYSLRTVTVSSLADSGTGTLRAALIDLQDWDSITITVGTPGTDTIELASALPEVTKSVTIEGNGITLTRSPSWTATSATSQLLYISGSAAQVTIRRVHFKDGRATDYGAGIRSTGALTLESCVFSRNQTSGTSAYGGAIYSTNTLTLRGCTFYGNASGRYGGAVYFSGTTLTLRGNLFYGNTATDRTVYVSGTVAASYNAIDKAFGTGTAASGWTASTGDIQIITGVPISPTTFKPYAGAPGIDEIGILPTTLTGFPVTDFYGNARTSPAGAAGAVEYGY
jgi:predicted outer membrane repeat protein